MGLGQMAEKVMGSRIMGKAMDIDSSWMKALKSNRPVEEGLARDVGRQMDKGKSVSETMFRGRQVQKVNDGTVLDKIKASYSGGVVGGEGGKITAGLNTARSVTGGYFLGADKTTNAIRMGTFGAGYVGVSGLTRAVSGGSMTRNKKGERDIAGIPFL